MEEKANRERSHADDAAWLRAAERCVEARVSAFLRRTLALPLPATQIAIRGLIFAGLREAQKTYDDVRFDTDDVSRERCLLIAGAIRIADMSGESDEKEVSAWLEDFRHYEEGLS
jgi:hypothetical protein